MTRSLPFAIMVTLAACDSDEGANPWDSLPLDATITVGLDARVDVARDKFGIAHIRARAPADLAFALGFVMAHDRLPQMDVLRRLAAGRLAELYGLDEGGNLRGDIIDSDLRMRMHGLRDFALQTWTAIDRDDTAESDLKEILEGFARGVNRYAVDLQSGTYSLDPAIAPAFRPEFFEAWTAVDSLLVAKLYAFATSYSVPFELEQTALYDAATAAHGPLVARDLIALVPVTAASTIDGFPNVVIDTGTQSDSNPMSRTSSAAASPASTRDRLSAAQSELSLAAGPFSWANVGGNSWAVAPGKTSDGTSLLAGDQHLGLGVPATFYPFHTVLFETRIDEETGDPVDVPTNNVLGVTLPGIPFALAGTNGAIAWTPTPSQHDANDVYHEVVTSCPEGSCVVFDNTAVPIRARDPEEIRIGTLGQIDQAATRVERYEHVPHHGPIIPRISADHRLLARDNANTLSVRYTGYAATHEMRALYGLARAQDVNVAFNAVGAITAGSQSWMIAQAGGPIAWTTHGDVPQRENPVYTWHPTELASAPAPFFVLSGTGTEEWLPPDRWVLDRYIPHAIGPASDFLVAAGADPVGATLDGNPLNQTAANDAPLYVGVRYDAGLRQQRIASVLAGGGATAAAMQELLGDTHSNLGELLSPAIVSALGFVDGGAGAPADVAPYVASLTEPERDRLRRARALLNGWSFATPTANDAVNDSAATIVFHTWMHDFLDEVLADELAAVGFTLARLSGDHQMRLAHALLVAPDRLVTNATTGQPQLCDGAGAADTDSCTKLAIVAMLETMQRLGSPPPEGFGTDAVFDWTWGARHALVVAPLLPGSTVPSRTEPLRGDESTVSRTTHGWGDLDFAVNELPVVRFVAELCNVDCPPGAAIRTSWAFAGGTILDSRSHHHGDLLDDYVTGSWFDAPYSDDEIVANGELRWELR